METPGGQAKLNERRRSREGRRLKYAICNDAILRVIAGLHGLQGRTEDLQARTQDLQARAKSEDGQTLAEYGLIMAVISVSVVEIAVIAFREAIVTAFNNAVECLDGSC